MAGPNRPLPTLVGAPLRRSLRGVLAELGKTAADRFDTLLSRAEGPRIPLSLCLEILCPGHPEPQALTNLRKLRERFNKAAAALPPSDDGHDVRFHVDTRKKSKPSDRQCWFTGRDQVVAEAERFGREQTEGMPTVVPSRRGYTNEKGQTIVNVFVSYARADSTHVNRILEKLRPMLKHLAGFDVRLWLDVDLLVGDTWNPAIEAKLRDCDLGVFFVSPESLTTEYIVQKELPWFLPSDSRPALKPFFPIGLAWIDFANAKATGVTQTQLHLHRRGDGTTRFYAQLTQRHEKDEFVLAAYLRLVQRFRSSRGEEGEGGVSRLKHGPPPSMHL